MKHLRVTTLFAAAILILACSPPVPPANDVGVDTGSLDAALDVREADATTMDVAQYALAVAITLTPADGGVTFFTQNGSMVTVPASDIIGKSFYWATTPGGQNPANSRPIEIGFGTIGSDLQAHFMTRAQYANGPFEMSVFVSVTASNPMLGPQPDDLAAFDLDAPPAGEPAVTGVSVRMRVHDTNASVNLSNRYFIRF